MDSKERVRVPLAQVIEAREVVLRSMKKVVQKRLVRRRIADKTIRGTAGMLHRKIGQTEPLVAEMLAHEHSTDFTGAGARKFVRNTFNLIRMDL